MSLTPLISELMLEQGRAQGSALSQIGQNISAIPQQMARDQSQQLELRRQGLQEQQLQMQIADQQRTQQFRSALSDAMKPDNVPDIDQDGLKIKDVNGMGKYMADRGYAADYLQAVPHIDGMNQSLQQFDQARKNAAKTTAASLLQTGGDPDLTLSALDTFQTNHVFGDATLKGYRDFINADPTTNAPKILRAILGTQKDEVIPPTPHGGGPAQLRDAVTHELIATGSPAEPEAMTKNQAITYLADAAATTDQKAEAARWLAQDKNTLPTEHVSVKYMEGGRNLERVMTVADALQHGPFQSQPPASVQVNNLVQQSKLPDFAFTPARPAAEEGNVLDRTIGMTPNGLYQAALANIARDTMPPRGMGQNPQIELQREAITSKVGAIVAASGLDKPALRDLYNSDRGSLAAQQKAEDSVASFIATADRNAAALKVAQEKIPDVGSAWLNKPLREWDKKVLSDPAMSAFATRLASVQSEYARILNGGQNISAVLSDSARHEAQNLLDGSQTVDSQLASLDALQNEGDNRLQSMADQIRHIVQREQNRLTPNLQGQGSQAPGGGAVNPFRPQSGAPAPPPLVNPFRPQPQP